MSNMRRLTLMGIEQGRLVGDADVSLEKLQDAMVRHAQEHGPRANGAKATLKLQVELVYRSETDTVDIVSKLELKLPARPATKTMGLPDVDDDRRGQILVARGGSRKDHPEQQVLTKDDGSPLE